MLDKAENKERGRGQGKCLAFLKPIWVTFCEGPGDHDNWDQLVWPDMS